MERPPETNKEFRNGNSWNTFDPSTNGVGINPIGYHGSIFDGRYIYFTPYGYNNATGSYNPHGEFLRYDTTKGFQVNGAWKFLKSLSFL